MRSLYWLKARLVFYPTLLWNMLLGRWLKVRNWWDPIDENVIVGAFPFARDVPEMAKEGVRAVVNTCEEYSGPVAEYEAHQIEQMRMPTVDFTHPSFDDVCRAVEFVDRHVADGHSVYIHCKAGRARSATVAICWLMKEKQISAGEAQAWLIRKRPHVNKKLPSRPVVQQYEKEFVSPKGVEAAS
jgi:atypical dual specificity phosphatase